MVPKKSAVYSRLDLLLSEREAELCAFEGLPKVGDGSAQVNA